MVNNYLLQMKEIMGVLDTKFDCKLQENLTRSQNSVIWAWIYAIWSIKNSFLKDHIFCACVIMECQRISKNGFFQILDPNIPKCTWDPKYLFFLWIWSSNGWLLLGDINYFWNIMHHKIIGFKVGTKTLAKGVSGNYLLPSMTDGDPKTIFFHRAIDTC